MVFLKLVQMFMFKDISSAENWTNLAGKKHTKNGFCRTRRTRFLQLCCRVYTVRYSHTTVVGDPGYNLSCYGLTGTEQLLGQGVSDYTTKS